MDDWTDLVRLLLAAWVAMGFFSVLVLWRLYTVARGFIALGMAAGGSIIFAAAAWSAWLTDRRLQGLEPIEWSPFVTVPLLLAALSVPIGAAAVLLWQRYGHD